MNTLALLFATLKNRKYINLTTFRKTGAAVATPLWFAEHQGVLYTQTFPTAGKLKRIKHTPRVTVAPCTVNGKALGAEIEGEARIITNEQEILLAEAALARKYGLTRRIYDGAMSVYGKLRRQAPSGRTYIAIEPVMSSHYSPRVCILTGETGREAVGTRFIASVSPLLPTGKDAMNRVPTYTRKDAEPSPHLQAPSSSRSLPRHHTFVVPLFFSW
jgi:uncharacterized protein